MYRNFRTLQIFPAAVHVGSEMSLPMNKLIKCGVWKRTCVLHGQEAHMNASKPSKFPFHDWKKVTQAAMTAALALGLSSFALSGGSLAATATAGAPFADSQSASNTITVPAGTTLLVRTIDSIDSSKNKVGDRFTASLEADLVANGKSLAPRGATVYGRLADAKSAGHLAGKSELKLELTDILINDRLQPILTGEYQLASGSRTANTAKKTVGGAAAGAIVGAIVGGGKGAAVGAGVGAGAGTAVQIFTKGPKVQVPSETVLEFRLQQPLVVSQIDAGN
jgi:hypothetical protein